MSVIKNNKRTQAREPLAYDEWLSSGVRYEWCEDDEESDRSDDFRTTSIAGHPTPVEWLDEYTGERETDFILGFGWNYPTYSDLVYQLAEEVTGDAYEKQYGPEWRGEAHLVEAADEDWSRLNLWIEDALTRCDWTTPAADDQQVSPVTLPDEA
jgi:hypothetical protein